MCASSRVTSGPNWTPLRMMRLPSIAMGGIGGGGTSRSFRGLVFRTWAANGQCNWELISPAKKKLLFLFNEFQLSGILTEELGLYLVGSAPSAGSSLNGVMSMGAPEFRISSGALSITDSMTYHSSIVQPFWHQGARYPLQGSTPSRHRPLQWGSSSGSR